MNCPKNVEFHAKINFVKLVHLVGFIIKKFITMHGHMNVKFLIISRSLLLRLRNASDKICEENQNTCLV